MEKQIKDMYSPYARDMRMRDVIARNPTLLAVLTRFGIALGFGEATVAEVCASAAVHTDTFLAVVNYMAGFPAEPKKVDIRSLVDYLGNAHEYFLEYVAPNLRRQLLEAISFGDGSKQSIALINFFDNYISDLRHHMEYEENVVFKYVGELLEGNRDSGKFCIADFKGSHKPVHSKLAELKDLLVCHFTAERGRVDKMNSLLFDIVTLERDLSMHCKLEDAIFIPVVTHYEKTGAVLRRDVEKQPLDSNGDVRLTAREREIISYVTKGMSNKEIAEKLFLSVYTVATHRRNICSKLNLHSASALAVYGIMHGFTE